MEFSYTSWIDQQAEKIEKSMRDFGRRGVMDVAIYMIPTKNSTTGTGELVVADKLPPGATDIVRLGAHGSNVMRVPYSHVRSLLWDACRSFPILPIE